MSLLESETPPICQPEAVLLDMIRRKTLGDPAGNSNLASLPQVGLMAMTLRSMLIVIRVLAKYRLIADDCTEQAHQRQMILAGSRVLQDWPKNFITLLKDLGKKLPADVGGGVGKQFEGIYRALFRNTAIEQGNTDFLRAVFLDFAMNHWSRGYVDHKLIKEMGSTGPKRFLTQTEFAAQIGVRQGTAARFLKGSALASRRVKCGKAEWILVDANLNIIPRTSPGRIFRKREAARRLGISVSVLQALKEASIYEVNHLSPTRPGFHELDLEALNRKFVTLASGDKSSVSVGAKGVKLQSVLRGHHDSTMTKLNVVRALLTKEVAVVGSADGTVGGMLLDCRACRELVATARNAGAGNAATAQKLAVQLSCDARARGEKKTFT